MPFKFQTVSARIANLAHQYGYNMIKRFKVLCIIILTSLALSGCVGDIFNGPVSNSKRLAAVKFHNVPKNIALMLPLHGSLASSGQAIKNGFLTAYYDSKSTYPDVTIKIADTTNANIAELYNQAIANGADVIVGPLTKQEVSALTQLGALKIPVIALNTLDNYQRHTVNNLYQFGLLPQDEVNDIVTKLLTNNLTRTAIITQDSPWSNKIAATFAQHYTKNGGHITASLPYAPQENLTAQICHLITADPTQMCAKHVAKTNITIQRRQDIDAIFLIATAEKARTIVPLLKFYYAGDLPIYSISSIYSGSSNPNLNQDLNGVNFLDMPWIQNMWLHPKLQAIHNQMYTTSPESITNHNKLCALGVDAYKLALSLTSLISNPNSGIAGATGTLYLDKYNHIYRKMNWNVIQNGIPVNSR